MIGPAAVLDAAADLIEKDGWCRMQPTRGRHRCASAAIDSVEGNSKHRHAALNALIEVAGEHQRDLLFNAESVVTMVNDRRMSDKRATLRWFRKAAALLRERGSA